MKQKRVIILNAMICMLLFTTIFPVAEAIDSNEQSIDQNVDIARVFFLIGIASVDTEDVWPSPCPPPIGMQPICVLRIGKPLGRHILGPTSDYIDLWNDYKFIGIINIGEFNFICGILIKK